MNIYPSLEGKTYVVMGVINQRSIAWGIARALDAAGASLAFTYVGERFKAPLEKLGQELSRPASYYTCDVTSDEEIEQVTRQERAGQAHELDLEQGVKVDAHARPGGLRIQRRAQADDTRQQQHQRGQAIDDEDDAERRLPVRREVDTRDVTVGEAHQRRGDDHTGDAGSDVEERLDPPLALAEQEHDRRGREREQDGQDDRVHHASSPST